MARPLKQKTTAPPLKQDSTETIDPSLKVTHNCVKLFYMK